ncbi:NAD(P)/FAD-dependent oxidoreductase [Rhizobium sp. CFBP 8752]|uniref:NAD(P)/FAD-dependent oxidoreductase n=1 Tax=Rhizobium sp. CFBP 8752 TaxID=2775301 RepID=UPI00177C8F10|nr:NAD(P)/FAD-dependent oxidoreductase [Rhizobium sp. CFBP 8752]MBD8665813.1 NAD(P)/FAD-dependent oxidoreductase [Rhizobium sp. CFBP 8752]
MPRRDCVIIGGGPAGLTAAIYLARFHLSVAVFDDGTSRAASIPVSHNHAGFPGGTNGRDLLDRMRRQAVQYGTDIRSTRVTALSGESGDFVVSSPDGTLEARTILLATGVTNREPDMSKEDHDGALNRGLIRYCPVCDGFEVTDKRVAVIGTGSKACNEAVFLRSYTADITLLSPDADHGLSASEQTLMHELGITVIAGPLEYNVGVDAISIATSDAIYSFDSIYPALGSEIRSELAAGVGAMLSPEGCITVDSHQRTDIAGLYAAGDVVVGLDQISHAMGQAGVAATTIRNDLGRIQTLVR